MKQKLLSYVNLCNAPYEISFVLMIIVFGLVIFTYEFNATCIISSLIFVLGILDMAIKNDKYYRVKTILEERYGE
jgi:hypothetical protein